jgi:hypothetical protein
MTTIKDKWMTTGIKALSGAAFLLAFTVLVNFTAWAQSQSTHPDGPSTTYRGWGPAELTEDSYTCTLFESSGVRVGSATFHSDGRLDVTVGTSQAHFVAAPVGLTTRQPIDVASFPSIPTRFRNERYQLMVFTARFVVGENLFVNEPVTEMVKHISAIEARCVYVIDLAGNVRFCLNCFFTVS